MAKYFRGILGSQSPSSQPTGADTVARLVERVQSSTLLDDRRDAVRALKSLSKKFRLEVGTQGMDVLINVLQTDRGDGEIISYALETLHNVVTTHPPEEDDEEFVSEAPRNLDPEDLSGQFTEIFIKSTENVSLLLGLLEEYDFHIRRPTVRLLTSLLMNRSNQLQQAILVSPMGVSKLVDLLSDSREVIRNDGLLLLIQLTKSNAAIQKIVAFENAFERLLEIITEEGNSDGGIVVEDCLLLLLNLIRKNSSNQTFFKEGSFIQRLTPFFDLQSASQPKSAEAGWSAQKVTNIHLMLEVIRTMVSPSNPQQATLACQKVMHQCGLLQQLCVILMASGVPADILTETINTVSEVIRGNNTNQDYFASVTAPSNPPRPAIVVLLMSMVNEKQPFVLRCAVLYCFQCFLFKNEVGQAQIVSTLLPSSAEVGAVTAGQLLCGGLFSLDSLSNWCAAVALAHALKDNGNQKEQLLRVQLATSLGTPPVSLLQQCTNILAQPTSKLQSKVGLLILLCSWASSCPIAVTHFLNNPSNVPYLTSQVADNVDETDQVIQGLSAFLLGICLQFNDDSIAAFNKENLRQLIAKRIGVEAFIEKLDAVSKHECYTKAAKKPQMKYDSSDQLLFDYEFTSLFKQLEGLIVKSVQGSETTQNSTENHQKTIEAHDNIVTQYKELIREQDKELQDLKNEHKDLQTKYAACNTQIEEQLSQIQQLKDQYAVLKGQQDAMGQGDMVVQQAAVMESFGISANTEETSKLQQEIEEMKKQNENLQQLMNEKDETIEKLKNDLTVSEAKVVVQEESQHSGAEDASGVTELETKVTEQSQELEELKTVILEQESEVKRYQSQVEELTNQIQSMGQGSSESAADNAALIAEKAAMATKISELESQVSNANQESERLRKDIETVIKSKQELEDENKSLKEQSSSQSNDDELRNLNEQIKSLREEKEKVEDDKNKIAEDMTSTKKEQDDLLVLLADQDNKIDEYKKKLKELGHPVDDDDDDDLDGSDLDEDEEDDDDNDDGEN